MCGLAGFIDTSGEKDNQRLAAVVSQMVGTLRHRGPDDDATWTDAQAGIALGFGRLAILDLTESGRQPMHSRCERFVIVFNGEIYNRSELPRERRSQIPDSSWIWQKWQSARCFWTRLLIYRTISWSS